MGSGQHKDKNVDLYLETSKDLYLAGEWVEGAVYIDAHLTCPYTSLALKFDCWQECFWTESQSYGSHTVTIPYSNKVSTYAETLWLNNFGQTGVIKGQYTFPFKFLLPQALSGSLKEDGSNYIGYTLTAELSPISNTGQTLYPQSFSIPLNIDQPLRIPFGTVSEERINSPQCCGCCCSYGQVRVVLSCDKNAIKPGDTIKVRALIDNSRGKEKIKNVVFKLERNILKISKELRQHHDAYDKLIVFTSEKAIPAGYQDNIQFETSIPLNFSSKSTAIGTVITNYFTLRIASSMGCCSEAADSEIHLIYHTPSRQLEEVKKIPPPTKWNPSVAQTVVLNNLKPYIYRPIGNPKWQNRTVLPGVGNVGNLEQMASNHALNGPTFTNQY